MCPDCKEKKDAQLLYARCNKCGNWRPMTPKEIKKVARRKRG